MELAIVVDKLARRVPEAKALDHVGGYALAIDLTARELQDEAKKVGGVDVFWWKGRGGGSGRQGVRSRNMTVPTETPHATLLSVQ